MAGREAVDRNALGGIGPADSFTFSDDHDTVREESEQGQRGIGMT